MLVFFSLVVRQPDFASAHCRNTGTVPFTCARLHYARNPEQRRIQATAAEELK